MSIVLLILTLLFTLAAQEIKPKVKNWPDY